MSETSITLSAEAPSSTDWTDCGWHEADRHDHSVREADMQAELRDIERRWPAALARPAAA